MTYLELLQIITKPLPDHQYYSLLLSSADTIVGQTAITSKGQVAKDLGMNPTVFATTYKFLFAQTIVNKEA